MDTMVPKKEMSESEIRLHYIDPALFKSWDKNKIRTEVKITDGRVNIKGNLPTREKPGIADYVLYSAPAKPLAILEAKDNTHTVAGGLQQALEYSEMCNVKFAYSSNGDAFIEHDFFTGTERRFGMDEFPTEEELLNRYKTGILDEGHGLTPEQEALMNQPFYISDTTNEPRYYQVNAVNMTLDAIGAGQKRMLLVMATGTGKTFVAFQIVYRLLESGFIKKVLYLADRNVLVDQSIDQDFKPLSKVIHKINYSKDDPDTISAYQVYFALYQQLIGKTDGEDDDEDAVQAKEISQNSDSTPDGQEDNSKLYARLQKLFKPNFFDLVIVDECHRGSVQKDSNWRRILEYFSPAMQLGMTATPRETKYESNIDYFGKPVYVYSLKQGIEDGFLAPYRVIKIKTNISDGWTPKPGQKDINGKEIEIKEYTDKDFDYKIIIEDRIQQVAKEITRYLKKTDRMAKTIVFCANEEHADRMREALINLNSDMVKINSDYIVRITGSDRYGKDKLPYFISVNHRYPVIATTSKLLSTGADCKMTKLIVLDEVIGSMTEFKQIIGRGTRLREKEDKMSFVVMDFRNVTQLFSDPDWDGPIDIDDSYDPDKPDTGGEREKPGPRPPREVPIVDADGCTVKIDSIYVSRYDSNGTLLVTEKIEDYTRKNILGEFATYEQFIQHWTSRDKKPVIAELLASRGIDLEKMKAEKNMADVDDFDFICHVAYGRNPITRRDRAKNVHEKKFFEKYTGPAREVLEALLDKYMDTGIRDIEDPIGVLDLDEFRKFGQAKKIAGYFGGRDEYLKAVEELEKAIYSDLAA